MTCDEADILLHALLDGELDAGHAREVENHIAACPRCAAALNAYREMNAAIAAADVRFTAPAHLRQRIEAALPQSRGTSRRSVLAGFAMGSAVSAMAATGIVAIVLRNDDEQRIASEVVSAHLRSLQTAVTELSRPLPLQRIAAIVAHATIEALGHAGPDDLSDEALDEFVDLYRQWRAG